MVLEVSQLKQNQRKLAILVGKASRQLNREGGFESLDLVKEVSSGLLSGLARGLTGGQLDISDAAPNVALENSQIEYLKNLQSGKWGHGLYNLIASLDDEACSKLLSHEEKAKRIETVLKIVSTKDSGENRELYSDFLEDVIQADNVRTRAKQGTVGKLRRHFEPDSPESEPPMWYMPTSSLHSPAPRPPGDRPPARFRFDGPPVQASGGEDERFGDGGGGQAAAGFFSSQDSYLFPPARGEDEPVIISEPARDEGDLRGEPAVGGDGRRDEPYGAPPPPPRGGGGWEAPPAVGGGVRRVRFADRGEDVREAPPAGGGDGRRDEPYGAPPPPTRGGGGWEAPPPRGGGGRRGEADGGGAYGAPPPPARGGGDWRDELAGGVGGWRGEADGGGGGRRDGPAPEGLRGWNPNQIVATSPLLSGDSPSQPAIMSPDLSGKAQDEVEGGDSPVKAVKKFAEEQVGNRLRGIANAGRSMAGATDALIAGNKDAVLMRVEDVGDNFVNGVVFAQSPSDLQKKADFRRAEENDRRGGEAPLHDESQIPKIVQAVSDRAGALFFDASLHAMGAVIDGATLDPEGVKRNAEALVSDFGDGFFRGKSLQERDLEAEKRRRAEQAEAERAHQLEQQRRVAAELARRGEGGSESSPRENSDVPAEADIGFGGGKGSPLQRASAIRMAPPSVDDEEELKFKIRKSGWKNYFKSFIPKCCSCCSCGILGPEEFEEYKLKPKKSFSFEYEEDLLEKVKRSRGSTREESISVGQNPAKPLSQLCTATENFIDKKGVDKNKFISELTFVSTDEAREDSRKNTLFRTITLNQDSQKRDSSQLKTQDNTIKIGDCVIKEINVVDLKSNVHKSRIFLDKNGVEAIKQYTESHEKLFLKYFLSNTSLTVINLLNQKPIDEPSLKDITFTEQQMQEAQKKASEAAQILVERKMERGDFKFDLDDPDKEIAYVKVLREIDKSGNVKKDNKVEIKTGKEFSDDLKLINIHVGDSDYIQICLGESKTANATEVKKNLNFFRKNSANNFYPILPKDSSSIKSSNIKIISHDNEETKFKAGNIVSEDKKSSCFSCFRKNKPKIKESGVIRYEDGGWNIEFKKTDDSTDSTDSTTSSAKLIMSSSGKISFDEKDPENKKIADAFRKALGDSNEERKFKLLKDNETYEVTIGGTQIGRTFRNTGSFFRGKTHGNGILKVEKISGNNLTAQGAVIDDATSTTRGSWASCFVRRGGGKKQEVIDGGGGEERGGGERGERGERGGERGGGRE